MGDFTFHERECEGRLEVARYEDDSYTFATVEEDGRSTFLILDRGEVEALVSALSELLDFSPIT